MIKKFFNKLKPSKVTTEIYTYLDNGEKTITITKSIPFHKKTTTRYIYSKDGEVAKIVDGNIVSVRKYDKDGHLTLQCKGYEDYFLEYDENGKLIKNTHIFIGDGHRRPYKEENIWKYDEHGNCVYCRLNGVEVHKTFDEFGHETHYKDSTGKEVFYHFDENGNLIKESRVGGETKIYKYDEKGNVISSKSITENSTFVFNYEYDVETNKISCCRDEDGSMLYYQKWKNINGTPMLVFFTDFSGLGYKDEYDEKGNLISYTRFSNEVYYPFTRDAEYWIKYTYDENNNMIESIDSDGNKEVKRYDDHGNCTYISNRFDTKYFEYEYDKLGRLIKKISKSKIYL